MPFCDSKICYHVMKYLATQKQNLDLQPECFDRIIVSERLGPTPSNPIETPVSQYARCILTSLGKIFPTPTMSNVFFPTCVVFVYWQVVYVSNAQWNVVITGQYIQFCQADICNSIEHKPV